MKDSFDYDSKSIRPKRSSGTRWISFKLAALKLVLDKFAVYIQHLEHLISDNSSESVDPVSFSVCLKRAKDELKNLADCESEDLPAVKKFLSTVIFTGEDENGSVNYNDVQFSRADYDKCLSDIKINKNKIIENLLRAINKRFEQGENLDEVTMTKATTILNNSAWEVELDISSDNISFADDDLQFIYKHFEKIMNLSCSFSEILDEWHDMSDYSVRFLHPAINDYNKTWKYIFQSVHSQSKWKNILAIIELLYIFPISNAKLERLFSLLKRTTTDTRCSIGEHRLTRLTNNLRILAEGPSPSDLDVNCVFDLRRKAKIRRPNQNKRKVYSKRQSNKMRKTNTNLDIVTIVSNTSDSDSDSEQLQLKMSTLYLTLNLNQSF
ncbi:hypothetical protein SNE40_004420 [Patella caerulea]|uniref:HAT C-terminal dimerisation domain-containing protein n=1 Tax=Patella caerulea TaxID=87958 RepID=A0AAN8QCD6_PATCE